MNDNKFEWQADGDENLTEIPKSGRDQAKRRKLWLRVGACILTAIVCLIVVRYYSQQQQGLEEKVRQDIATSFGLWKRAVGEEDGELFTHLLASGDRDWQWKQRALFERDLILNRDFLSLTMNDGPDSQPGVILATDWQRATVTFEQVYSSGPIRNFGGPVRLRQTIEFENSHSDWMQTAPDEDYWGDWMQIESDLLVIHYPERDEDMARRIGQQLNADLANICGNQVGGGDKCAPLKPFVLTMSSDSESLLALESPAGSLLSRSNFRMPSPTIVGLPVDELSFQAYYHGYTREILDHVRSEISLLTPLPDQPIRALCFDHPSLGPKLYKYDPAFGVWEAELTERNFRFLLPLAGDQGLILDELVRLGEPGHSRLIKLSGGTEELLLDEVTADNPYRVISPAQDGGSHLLLRRLLDDQLNYAYKRIDLTHCPETGCDLQELPGYAIWSPDEQQTILQIGSDLFLGDDEGSIEEAIGSGFSPFWLNEDEIGSVRFIEGEGRLYTALFVNQISSREEWVVFDSRNLAEIAGVDKDSLSMRYVAANPADQSMLLVHALGFNDYAGEYFLFSVQLPDDELANRARKITLHIRRKGSPIADSGLITSSGYMPFSPSPDGRWLLVSELAGSDPVARTFLLHDLRANETRILAEGETVVPAQSSSYDWSYDGRWLVIAGEHYFRLIAPADDYEQVVPHDFDACPLVRWSN